MKPTVHDRRHLARLVRLLRQCAARRPRRVFLEEAEIELWGLYRREQAELLARAAALRVPPPDLAARAAWRAELRAWRHAAAECALLTAADGYPLAEHARSCLAAPVHGWPSARCLAEAAERLGGRAPSRS
jgi:hypothetical protein